MGATVFAEDFTESGIGKAMGAAGGVPELAVPAQRETLKRAPSYGVVVHQKKAEKEKEKEKVKTVPEPTPRKPVSRGKDAVVTPVTKTPAASHRTKPVVGCTPSPAPTISSPCSTNHSPTNTHTNCRSLSPAVYSSDEEEKRRAKTIKRFKGAGGLSPMHRKPSFLGPELPKLERTSSAEGQTITVETYTLASMTSMESLASAVPTLSTSSSVSALSLRSVETFRTDAKASRKAKPAPNLSMAIPTRTPAAAASVVQRKGKEPAPLVASPLAMSQSPSPPRTLRRVGNKSIKLEPFIPSPSRAHANQAQAQVPRPSQTPKRPHGLSELSRALSFGSGSPTSSAQQSMAGLLGAAFGLDSPFEEKKPSSKKGGQYLF